MGASGGNDKQEKTYLLTQSMLEGIILTYKELPFTYKRVAAAIEGLENMPVHFDPLNIRSFEDLLKEQQRMDYEMDVHKIENKLRYEYSIPVDDNGNPIARPMLDLEKLKNRASELRDQRKATEATSENRRKDLEEYMDPLGNIPIVNGMSLAKRDYEKRMKPIAEGPDNDKGNSNSAS